MRVVVENSIGALKDWRILQRYRHYRLDHDESDRKRLGQVARVLAALINWRSHDRIAAGKPRRRLNWKPTTNSTYVRKLLTEAEKLKNPEKQRFADLIEGKKTPAELGLLGQRLTAEQEALLCKKGDTTETWEIIEEVKGVVLQRNADGDVRVVKADSRAAASASRASDFGTSMEMHSSSGQNGAKRKLVVDE
jgi:hypothetical protein